MEEVGMTTVEDLGFDSDDSVLYGDDEDQLEQRLLAYDQSNFWKIHESLPATIAVKKRKLEKQLKKPSSKDKAIKSGGRLHWPLDGEINRRQSNETVEDFIKRLKPSQVKEEDVGPWIWVDNPHHDRKSDSKMDLEALQLCGKELLDSFIKFKTTKTLQTNAKSKAATTRALAPHISKLREDLRQVAINANCVSGKWMLFISVDNIDKIWSIVAEGVSSGDLGPLAKVAVGGGERDAQARLICIYTKDFSDKQDVRRVLNGIVKLGLHDDSAKARGIWYKCDAYTHWGITGTNDYGVTASIYGSKDMLAIDSGTRKRKI